MADRYKRAKRYDVTGNSMVLSEDYDMAVHLLKSIEQYGYHKDQPIARHVREFLLAQSSIEPMQGAGQMCALCGNVHDLMSACPPRSQSRSKGVE